jgi:hypothetical protein
MPGGGTQGSARGVTRLDGPPVMIIIDYTAPLRKAAVLCGSPTRTAQLKQLVEQCGCQIRTCGEAVDYLLIDLCSNLELAPADWEEIRCYVDDNEAEILVWAPIDRVEAAFAALPTDRCHFFVDSADWQAIPILSGAMRLVKAKRFGDSARDGAQGEILRAAPDQQRTGRFRPDAGKHRQNRTAPRSKCANKPVSFPARAPRPARFIRDCRCAAPDAFRPGHRMCAPSSSFVACVTAISSEDLFADPGWDILLDLYAARQEGKQVSVSSLCIAAAVPPTTALALDHQYDRGRFAGPACRIPMTHGGCYRTVRRSQSDQLMPIIAAATQFGRRCADMTCHAAELWQRRLPCPAGALSSVGRASRLHREGQRFEPVSAHQDRTMTLPFILQQALGRILCR